MDNFEIKNTLDTFRIVVDRREQNTQRAAERYAAFGVPIERATLSYGDYCGNITLPSSDLYDIEQTISPAVFIERKMNLDEAASCFATGRKRFEREFERAKAAGAHGWLLIEGASWESIEKHRYRSRLHPNAFRASLIAWSIRYDLKIVFCRSGTSGSIIKEILFREMKERLESGIFG